MYFAEVQHPREQSLETCTDNAGMRTPQRPHPPTDSHDTEISTAREPFVPQAETPSQLQRHSENLYLYSNHPPSINSNSLNLLPRDSELSPMPFFSQTAALYNCSLPFPGMSNSGLTFVSHPQNGNNYIPGSAALTPYTGDSFLHQSHLAATWAQPPGLYRASPERSNSNALNSRVLTFDPGLNKMTSLNYSLPGSDMLTYSCSTSSQPQSLYITHPGIPNTVSQSSGNLSMTTQQKQDLSSTDSFISIVHIKEETQPIKDDTVVTRELGSTDLSNIVRNSDARQKYEYIQWSNNDLKCKSATEQVSKFSKSVPNLPGKSLVKEEQDNVIVKCLNIKPEKSIKIEEHDVSNDNLQKQDTIIATSIKSKSFMIDALLGSQSFDLSTLVQQPSSSGVTLSTDCDQNQASLSARSVRSVSNGEDVQSFPATSKLESLSVADNQEPAGYSSCSETAISSSEEVNVVDFTSSEDSNCAHVAITKDIVDIESPVQVDFLEKVETGTLVHNNGPLSGAVVVSNKINSPDTPKSKQRCQVADPSSKNVSTTPATDSELRTAAKVFQREATEDESNNKDEKQELPVRSVNRSLNENDSAESEGDSVFFYSKESTPSKSRIADIKNSCVDKCTPSKSILHKSDDTNKQANSPTSNLFTPRKLINAGFLSPSVKTQSSPNKRRKNVSSENLVSDSQTNFKDSPCKRKCLEEIPENSQTEVATSKVNSDCDAEKSCPKETDGSQRRRARCLAFSSSSEDDMPKPRPKRPPPRRPRPKYTSTPVVPSNIQFRTVERSHNFQDILFICGEYFQQELSVINSSASQISSTLTTPTLQPSENHCRLSSSTQRLSLPTAETNTSQDGQNQKYSFPSLTSSNDSRSATGAEQSPSIETSSKDQDNRADSGIASMLDGSSHENLSAFLESIKSRVMTDPNYTMRQFRQDVLKFNRLSNNSKKNILEAVRTATPGNS